MVGVVLVITLRLQRTSGPERHPLPTTTLESIHPSPPVIEQPSPPIRPSAIPQATSEPPREVSPDATLDQVESGPVTLTWHGRLTASSGNAPPIGSPCTVTLVVRGGTELDQEQLTFQCSGQLLYDSSVPLNGMATKRFGVEEVPTAGAVAAFRYKMVAEDVGPRSAPRAQISLDTSARIAEVFRDTNRSFRIRAALETYSAERQGRALTPDAVPPFSEVVVRKGRVLTKSGAVPFAGSGCELTISPGYVAKHQCRILFKCGKRMIYGGGYADCAIAEGRPVSFVDAYPTPTDGDPEINCNLEAGTVSLGDTSKSGATYSVTLSLVEPPRPPTASETP